MKKDSQPNKRPPSALSLRAAALEEVEEDVERVAVLTELGDDGARAAHDLLRLTLAVDLAETAPLADTIVLALLNHDEMDALLLAERAHEACVLLVVAVLRQAAELGGVGVECLGRLAQAAAMRMRFSVISLWTLGAL